MQAELYANKRYNSVSIILHWVLGAALVAIFFFGNYMVDLPFSPQRLKLYNWHKWAGISILALSALRLLWRLTHPAPALPAKVEMAMPTWQLKAHQLTHVALYALFFIVPLVGWAYTSAAGFPVVLFGLFQLPDLVGADKALAALIKPWHQISAFAFAGLVVLHIAAALKHQFVDRDGLLKRMSLRAE
jgi:cytochrome b561